MKSFKMLGEIERNESSRLKSVSRKLEEKIKEEHSFSQSNNNAKTKGEGYSKMEQELLRKIESISTTKISTPRKPRRLTPYIQKVQRAVTHDNTTNRHNYLIDSTNDPILALDDSFRILTVNKACVDIFQDSFGFVLKVGDSFIEKLDKFPQDQSLYQDLWRSALNGKQFTIDMPVSCSKKEFGTYEAKFNLLKDRNGKVLGAACFARDVSARINENNKLSYLAKHDPVTGIYNRRGFLEKLNVCVKNVRIRETSHALLYLDLENFKAVSELGGHTAGDKCLRHISEQLKTIISRKGLLARIRGGEFAAILKHCSTEDAESMAEEIKNVVSDYQFEWRGRVFRLGVSIGIVSIEDNMQCPKVCLELADLACYASKASGKNSIHFHGPLI